MPDIEDGHLAVENGRFVIRFERHFASPVEEV
jgi:hypothetical protein